MGRVLLLLVLLGNVFVTTAWARDEAGIPLPSGARARADGGWTSPWGWRKTVEYYQRVLPERGARLEPVVRWRNVAYLRALPSSDTAPFRAVHIVLADGATTIYILRR